MNPNPDDHLTVMDVDDLANGTATVVTVSSPTHRETWRATVDERGFLRSLGPKRRFFPQHYEVMEVGGV